MPDIAPGVQLAIGLCTLAAFAFGLWKWLAPKVRGAKSDARAIRDTLVGREALRDSITGREISPAVPGIGSRMADQEKHAGHMAQEMGVLTRAVADLASSQARLDDHERRITDNDRRLTSIEQGHHLERMAGKAESIHLFRAIESIAHDDTEDRP